MTEEVAKLLTVVQDGMVPIGYTKGWHLMPEEWKDVPLSYFFKKKSQKNIGNKVKIVFTNSAVNGIIPQSEYFEKDIANSENTAGYFVVEPLDYVYNPRISENAPYGPFKRNDTGLTGIVSPLYTVLTPRKEFCDSKYLHYYLESAQWHKYVYSIANCGARFDRMNITDDELMRLPIAWPTLAEQERIVEILRQCDRVIELKQEKISELKRLKKECLRTMFPAKGHDKPKTRFPGFTDAWEQRKFNEVFEFMQNNSLSRAELSYEGGEALNVHYGDILVKYGEVLNVERDELTYLLDSSLVSKYQVSLLQNGDIIIADAAEDETVGKCSEIVGLTTEIVLSGLHTIPCRPTMKFAEGYLGYYMNSNAYHNQLLPLIQGTKISSISKSAIQDTEVMYPKSENEQAQIGAYFSGIDHLITLHQRELDEAKVNKKALAKLLLTGVVRVRV